MKNKLEIIDDFLSDEDYNDLINNLKEIITKNRHYE